jgi:hypothetical protein
MSLYAMSLLLESELIEGVVRLLYMFDSFLPFTSAFDFTRKVIETLSSNPYPDYVKRNYYFKPSGNGIQVYVVYDIDKGKEEEGLQDIMSRMCQFGTCIEGVSGTLEPVLTAEQMLAMMGQMMSQEQAPTT